MSGSETYQKLVLGLLPHRKKVRVYKLYGFRKKRGFFVFYFQKNLFCFIQLYGKPEHSIGDYLFFQPFFFECDIVFIHSDFNDFTFEIFYFPMHGSFSGVGKKADKKKNGKKNRIFHLNGYFARQKRVGISAVANNITHN